MSIRNEARATMRLCTIDSDPGTHSIYEQIAKEQAMELHFFQSAGELLEQISLGDVQILIIDLESDADASLGLQRDLLQADPTVPVIATTAHWESKETVASLGLGAMSVLQRPWSPDRMRECVRVALQQAQTEQCLKEKHGAMQSVLTELTPRQHRVLELAAAGLPNKLIAANIDVSQRTVEAEKSKVLTLFQAPSYPALMVALGEARILDELFQTRHRVAQHRLRIFATPGSTATGTMSRHRNADSASKNGQGVPNR